MGQAGSTSKVRQIAIVLTSMDAATAKRILASLPPDVAKPIRQLIGKLGNVSEAEREQAFKAISPILKIPPQSPAQPDENPAEQLLRQSSEFVDKADFAFASNFQPTPTYEPSYSTIHTDYESSIKSKIVWLDATTTEWAQILQVERPIIIASIIAQAPRNLASEILQELPGRIAVETLAEMPKIGSTSIDVLEEICAQLNVRLREYRSKSLTNQWGLQKAKGIFESLPESMRTNWVQQIESIDPSVARELAPLANKPPAPKSAPTAQKAVNSATYSRTMVSNQGVNLQVVVPNDVPADTRADGPVGAPAKITATSIVAYDAEDFEALIGLPLNDLARVIRICEPDVVLAALAGASRRWMARFEKMIHPKEVDRLRARLESNQHLSLKEIDKAQAEIVAAAAKLGLFAVDPSDLMAA